VLLANLGGRQIAEGIMAPLPVLPAPFDHVATRRVGRDGLVAFEGRQYSVPFAYLDRSVEVRGGAGTVQELAAMPVQHRPLDLYAALAEAAR